MQIIVPLAGPDFEQPDGSLKPLMEFNGEPLLLRALTSRIWARHALPSDYTFVLRDTEASRGFLRDYLQSWYPGSRHVFVSDYTRGAALSAGAGVVAQGGPTRGPVIVDLADILYSCGSDPSTAFKKNTRCGGVGLVFDSDSPFYSYLRTDATGAFVEAAEKRVISSNASAGTYMFSDTACYLRALAHAIENAETQTHRNLFFICPLFNGVRAQERAVMLHSVTDVFDIKEPKP